MNPYSRFFRPLLPTGGKQVIDSAVAAFVDCCADQITSRQAVRENLAAVGASRVVTVGASPDDTLLLSPHGLAEGCVPIGAEWGASGEQLVGDLNKLMEEHGIELKFQWIPDVEPTPQAMGHRPTVGLASCTEPPQTEVQDRTHELPIQHIWHLSDTPVAAGNWSLVANGNQTVTGSIIDNTLVVSPEHAGWKDALAMQGGQPVLDMGLFNATMGTGQAIQSAQARVTVDASTMSMVNGTVIDYVGAPTSEGVRNIAMVYLPPEPGPDAQLKLTQHLLRSLGVETTPIVQADVTGTMCEATPVIDGVPATSSVLPISEATCTHSNFWPVPSGQEQGPLLGPLDLSTLSSAYPPANSTGVNGTAPAGFSLSDAQLAVQEMVATRYGAQMTGAFCAGLASTVVHHLLTQGTERLPRYARLPLNTVLIPALRSIVYAVMAYHFTTGATSVFRLTVAGVPALVQGLSLVTPLPQFIRALATALSVSGIALTVIEIMRGDIMPGMALLATVAGNQVAHLVMAAFDELLRHLAPQPEEQELRLERMLYATPANSPLSELADCAHDRGAPQVSWPESLIAVGAAVEKVDQRLTQAIDTVVTLRPISARLTHEIKRCTQQLQAVSESESSSSEDERFKRGGTDGVELDVRMPEDDSELSDDADMIQFVQTAEHFQKSGLSARSRHGDGSDSGTESGVDEVTAVHGLFPNEGADADLEAAALSSSSSDVG